MDGWIDKNFPLRTQFFKEKTRYLCYTLKLTPLLHLNVDRTRKWAGQTDFCFCVGKRK